MCRARRGYLLTNSDKEEFTMPSHEKRSKSKPITIGSQLSSGKRKALHKLKKENQAKIEAALKNQRTKSAVKPIRRISQTIAPEEKLPPPSSPFEYWDFPSGMSTRDAIPDISLDFDTAELENLLRRGEETPHQTNGEEIFVNLGIDFGSSCTKVIARFPYEADEPTIAIPAPVPCRVQNGPHLWCTKLWLEEDGTAYMWPVPKKIVLDTIKQDLVLSRGNIQKLGTSLANLMGHEKAAIAYLAYVIRYVRGWLQLHYAQAFVNRNPVWRINVGMPTESFDEPKLADSYRRVVAAALLLADLGLQIDSDSTQLVLDETEIVEAGQSIEAGEKLGVGVVPEAAAEMTGFAKSTRRAPGLYMMIDVGAMTLDTSMFTLHSNRDNPTIYSFMDAKVRPLGVESYYWFRENQAKTNEEFGMQCEHTLRSVIITTKKRKDPHSERWEPGESVPIFLVGGGAKHPIHRSIVDNLDPWMKESESFRNEGTRLVPQEFPSSLDTANLDIDYGRMGVAWGLSFDFPDIGVIHSVSEIDDVSLKTNPWREKYIEKYMV